VLVAGCVPPQAFDTSPGHISQPSPPEVPVAPPPAPVRAAPALAPPRPSAPVPTYTVVVNDVPVKDLLFSIARDTQYNIDLHPGITGRISLNAVQETLPAILDRIARQANLRYEMNGRTVSIMPDTPLRQDLHRQLRQRFPQHHLQRRRGGADRQHRRRPRHRQPPRRIRRREIRPPPPWPANPTTTCGRCWPTTSAPSSPAPAQSPKAPRNARRPVRRKGGARRTRVAGRSRQQGRRRRRQPVHRGVCQPALGDGKNDVAVNPVAGTVSVLGTAKQQELVQQYLDRVMQSAQRQVLIEATIVEVNLKDQYRAGIDWSKALQGATGWSINTLGAGTNALAGALTPFIQATYTNSGSNGFTAAIDLLESFGNTRVLSSPKLMALNNQTALLKVVNNLVYFTIKADTTTAANVGTTTTFTTTPQTVPVGMVMTVLPQINENGMVSLTVRPTISRNVGTVGTPIPNIPAEHPQSGSPSSRCAKWSRCCRSAAARPSSSAA
jgi:type II secretory pathway component GspD/PulD (secretin)